MKKFLLSLLFLPLLMGAKCSIDVDPPPNPCPNPPCNPNPCPNPPCNPDPTPTPGTDVYEPELKIIQNKIAGILDYKISPYTGIGYLLRHEGKVMKLMQFDGKAWIKEEVIKNKENSQPILWETKNAKFLSPKIAVSERYLYLVWGNGSFKNNGLSITQKDLKDEMWQVPLSFYKTKWIETHNIIVHDHKPYLVHNEIDDVNGGGMVLSTINELGQAAEFAKIKAPFKEPEIFSNNKDQLWALSWFYNGNFINILDQKNTLPDIKDASFLNAVFMKDKDYHAVYHKGGVKKIGDMKYYFPLSVQYQNSSYSVLIHNYKAFTDDELKAGKQWVREGHLGITSIGGAIRAFYDDSLNVYGVLIKDKKANPIDKANGPCEKIFGAQFANERYDMFCENGIELTLKRPEIKP